MAAVKDNWPSIARALKIWGIYTPKVCAGIVGTIAAESGSFYPIREAWFVYDVNPDTAMRYYADTTLHAPYDGGPWWHGRGYIQITHKSTYIAFNNTMKEKFGIDTGCDVDPEKMLTPEVSSHAAAWFFINKGIVEQCEASNWAEVRRRVWGQYGDTKGVAKLQHAEKVLVHRL